MSGMDLAHWWRDVNTPPTKAGGARMRTLILVATAPSDVANLKADLPESVRRDLHELHNMPPAPAFPSIVHGSFTAEPLLGAFFTVFTPSRLLRVAVVPEADAYIAALFAAQAKDPLLIVKGWPAGTGKALTAQLESARRLNIPLAFRQWCSVMPHPLALVLAGTATHHLALMAPRASLKYRHMTLQTVANVLHRWSYEMDGIAVLFVETSFDQALNPDLAGTGLQGVLRALVQDIRRPFDLVILCGDEDPAKFLLLNHPRHQSWYEVILPEDTEPISYAVAASSASKRPPLANTQHPLMKGFTLDPAQRAMVFGERPLYHEDTLAAEAHIALMRRRAAIGR